MYNNEINENHCRRCFEQDSKIAAEYSGRRKRYPPQSFWSAGKNLSKNGGSIRVAFVGKNSWNDSESLKGNPKIGVIYDCRDMGPGMWHDKTPYWTALRTTTEGLKLTLDDVFITNLAKCNVYEEGCNSYTNITSWEYFDACKDILAKEIQIVKPTHAILLTGDNYDSLIRDLRFEKKPCEVSDCTSDSYKKDILVKDGSRRRPVCWWSRTIHRANGTNLHLLRTRHPQGAPEHFVSEIVERVKGTR